LRPYRIFVALSFSCASVVAGCGNLIGLGGYSVADDGGRMNEAGAGSLADSNVAGGSGRGGSGGEDVSEGGTSGASEDSAGAAGASGSEEAGGAAASGSGGSSSSAGWSGSAGTFGGAPPVCPGSCGDDNDCTTDSCMSGACVHQALALGTACGTARSCDAQALCVRCRDTAKGSAQDVGCSPTAPICLGTGLDAACAGCSTQADCPASGDACKPNTCDATQSCKQVDISVFKTMVGVGSAQGNGGFELSSGAGAAVGWTNIGTFKMIYSCGPTTSGCDGSNGPTVTQSGTVSGGDYLAWLGGTMMASVSGVDHLIVLPAFTTKLQVVADINFQTKSTAANNKDIFEVRLLDAAKVQVGPALYSSSNISAQTGSLRNWTADGIDKTIDVSAYSAAHGGADSYISFWSSVDGSLPTDFFIDNVRLTATVCQ
jgi:hypothetical protein